MKSIFHIILALFCFVAISIETKAEYIIDYSNQDNPLIRNQFEMREGIMAKKAKTVRFKEKGKSRLKVKLSKPVVVSRSEEPMEWGYYQFPSMYRMEDGNLLITWQMKEDSHKTLGGKDKGKNMMLSTNNGRTWIDYDNRYSIEQYYYSVKKTNGDCYLILSSSSQAMSSLSNAPHPVYQFEENGRTYSFYREKDLPISLQGVTVKKWRFNDSKPTEIQNVHASFIEDGLFKCAIDDHILLWVGRVLELSNNDVIACNFTSYHSDNHGVILPLGISFYKLNEEDCSLSFQGEMPYIPDWTIEPYDYFRKISGFSEPTFVELSDGKLLCVARSTLETVFTPLYKSISSDEGKTWSRPEAFTPNGVDPSLIKLGNGTLVLISGRPGVQLRFCTDGMGMNWTEPIEMMPYPIAGGKIIPFGGSCGYTDILPYDDSTFFIVYTVFDKDNYNGKYKKSIVFRKVSVINK